MTGQELNARRLASQQLIRPGFTHPGELVAYLGAVQAQDYNGAKWSLGVRLPGSTDHGIEHALAEKTFLRTWAMRGTLQFVAPADIRWLVALVGQRVIASIQGRYRRLELDEPTMARSNDLIIKALLDKPELDRKTLIQILEQNGISTRGLRAAHILQRASLEGLVCQAAAPQNNPTYLLLDSLKPAPKTMPHDEAAAELARRYFTSRGPATLKDFAWWSGLPVSDARNALDEVRSQLSHESIEGQEYWQVDGQPPNNDYTQTLFLLSPYDEYLISYHDRNAAISAQQTQLLMRGNGFSPYMIKNGQFAGTWKRTKENSKLAIHVSRALEFSEADMDRLASTIKRLGEFLETDVKIAW